MGSLGDRGCVLGNAESSLPAAGDLAAMVPPDEQLLDLRARKFRALSTLFRLDTTAYESAIGTLLIGCPGAGECPVITGSVHQAGIAALDWVRGGAADVDGLAAEHTRLFGGADMARQMPMVSPCAAMYMTEEYDGQPADVSAVYHAVGFTPSQEQGMCPSHICNELDFMAYCLEKGSRDAATVAYAFVMSHLFAWGVVFSAATYARSTHPVTRFAGMMLEHLLFCELEHARDRSRYYGMLAEIKAVS